MSKFNVGDKVLVASYAETVSSGIVMSTAYGLEGVVDGYDSDGDVEVHFEDHEIQFIAPACLTLMEEEDIKVGVYLTSEDRVIVWKIKGVKDNGNIETSALFTGKASDTADTLYLSPVTVKSLIEASPEQIAAFDNHPFWGVKEDEEPVVEDAISPSVYQFPNGVEVRDISAHLTSFGGQAVQYIARATRLDGVVKGKPVEDLRKAIELMQWEAERLEALES